LQPLSALGVAATVPLAIALLTISRKLEWTTAPLAGLLLTYWTFAFRFKADEAGPALGVAALYAYWICFELYDLLRLREARARGLVDYALFPLNALMLLGTAMLTLPASSPVQSSNFLASLGVLFLGSTWLRMQWKAAAGPAHPVLNVLAQGYHIGAVLAAGLFAGALMKRFPAIRSEIGMLLEGQLFLLAGIRLGDRFFRRVGEGVFGVALAHLFLVGTNAGGWTGSGRKVGYWVAMAFAMAVVFYANRWLTREGPELTWPAAGLLMASSAGLLHNEWTAAAWMSIAFLLLEVYRRTGLKEFRYQGVVVGGFATIGCAILSYERPARQKWQYPAVDAISSILAYVAAWRLHRIADEFRMPVSAAGSLLAAWAAWLFLPAPLVAVAWGLMGLALLELGGGYWWLRWQAHALAYSAFARTFIANFPAYGETGGISHRLLTVVPLAVLAWHGWHRLRGSELGKREIWAARGYSFAAVLLMAALARFELGRTLAVTGWAAMMIVLLYFGHRLAIRDFRLQAYALAVATFARSWATNFASADGDPGFVSRLAAGLMVIAAFHGGEFLTPREQPRERWAFALLGVTLLSLLVFYEASGQALTLCWGAQAAGTLIAGFAARERVLRLGGLALFAICVLKLFLFDLRNLETMARIVSFIVLGLVFIGASWLYMRFREKIQRYL
ncbi:MAG: DUF2339 domain-containing protein, partial [Bryobacteraceae bacterium]|nr:DUF2339 domain-containing protein [Bryobacteraceae bacterium]